MSTIINTNDATPFTYNTLMQWLYTNGFTNTSTYDMASKYPVILNQDVSNINSSNIISFYTILGMGSNDGTNITVTQLAEIYTFDFAKSLINRSTSDSNLGINTNSVSDRVTQIL